jgi:hypothetical protein
MAWDDVSQIVSRLSEYLSSFDWDSAESLCMELIARLDNAEQSFPAPDAKEILARLRRKRRFRLMALVADALIRSGQSSPQVRRQYAQAMIDQGNLTAAEIVLKSLVNEEGTPQGEKAEARGLFGRIYKQLYVNANDPVSPRQQANLKTAFQFYHDVYRGDPIAHLWHGINAVALLARAHADRVPIDDAIDYRKLAHEILDELDQRALEMTCWDRATAVEAHIANGELDGARKHLLYFVLDPAADTFEVGSLLRQLIEVWRLVPDAEPGASLLPLLSSALLKREGGHVELQRSDITCGLEAVFGKDRYEPFSWFQTGLKRCAAVARIEDIMGRKVGTGFLVEPGEFFEQPTENPVLLTNAHVISPSGNPFPTSIMPTVAVAVFEALGQSYRIENLLWTSPTLDATFVSLEKMSTSSPCSLKPSPEPFSRDGHQRVYVIGYPLGGGLSISLQDSIWLDTDDTFLHYRTPTEPGSSGSPVFDQRYWTVVGLHHKGKSEMPRLNGKPGTYESNEAISINAIRKAMH